MVPRQQPRCGVVQGRMRRAAVAWGCRVGRPLHTAREHGLRPKLHADQLTDTGGAALAAEVGAASADHLECISEEGIAALANSDTVAVSLPLATLYLDEFPLPARALHEAGVPVAVATDFNPGSAPSYHLPLALMLACTLQRMTPAQALAGATRVAARAASRLRDRTLSSFLRAARVPTLDMVSK